MFPKKEPTKTEAWQRLSEHAAQMKKIRMADLFSKNANRFNDYSVTFNDILFDYSKNILNDQTRDLLLQLANEGGLADAIDALCLADGTAGL